MRTHKEAASAVAFCSILVLCLCADGLADLALPGPRPEGAGEETHTAVRAAPAAWAPAPTPAPTPAPEDAIPLDKPLAQALVESCEQEGVPLALALAVMEQESGFDPQARNQATGCYGLMQLSPDYFPADLSPEENLRAGVAYLGGLLETYGDEAHAVTAYYYGPTQRSTSWYSDQVLERCEAWRTQLGGGE